jgi:hypothetical protein
MIRCGPGGPVLAGTGCGEQRPRRRGRGRALGFAWRDVGGEDDRRLRRGGYSTNGVLCSHSCHGWRV